MTFEYLRVTGLSKKVYKFAIYPTDEPFKRLGGIYIYGRRYGKKEFDPIYCGRAKDFSKRFENHHKGQEIADLNPNCICILLEPTKRGRKRIETDILKDNLFHCNEVLNNRKTKKAA